MASAPLAVAQRPQGYGYKQKKPRQESLDAA